MLTLHHLNNSRSQRILWMFEELGLDYKIETYMRDTETNRRPPELLAVHPLGKSPVITDGAKTIAETGTIIEYVLRTHGAGKFVPALGSDAYDTYSHFLHHAEGSAMLPLLLALYTSRLGDAAAPIMPAIGAEIELHFDYYEAHLAKNDWFAGADLTGADFAMIFPLEAGRARGLLANRPHSLAYVEKVQARPAYQAGLAKGPDYAYAG